MPSKEELHACLTAIYILKDAKLVYNWQANWNPVNSGKTQQGDAKLFCREDEKHSICLAWAPKGTQKVSPIVEVDIGKGNPTTTEVMDALNDKVETLSRNTLENPTKEMCNKALDELEKVAELFIDWTTSWMPVHAGTTSKLGGLKPCSRKDSFAAYRPHHIGLGTGAKRGVNLPLVEASFVSDKPSVAQIVAALRKAVVES